MQSRKNLEAIEVKVNELSQLSSFYLNVIRPKGGDNLVNINFRFIEHDCVISGHFRTLNKFVKFQS